MRGEYKSWSDIKQQLLELPPRARRIRLSAIAISSGLGTTSACAENTAINGDYGGKLGNYLRVRGEYFSTCASKMFSMELPPRARRIPHQIDKNTLCLGTTSACAENTLPTRESARCAWNYLRVRGEYRWLRVAPRPTWELPPRARRIRCAAFGDSVSHGTTSACAENTFRVDH